MRRWRSVGSREGAGAKRVEQTRDDFPAKHATQDLHGQKERRARMHPPRPVGRETAGGHDAVHVRVVQERLPPGVEDAQKAKRGAEVLRRARDLEECRRTRLEEEVVHHPFVLQARAPRGRAGG